MAARAASLPIKYDHFVPNSTTPWTKGPSRLLLQDAKTGRYETYPGFAPIAAAHVTQLPGTDKYLMVVRLMSKCLAA